VSWKNSIIVGSNQKRGGANQPTRGDITFVMSRSQLVEFAQCPAKWLAGGPVREETKSMTFGSVLDCLATTPEAMAEKFAVTPELYPATPKKKGDEPEMKEWTSRANFCKDWEAEKEASGLTVVSPAMMEDAKKAFASINSNTDVASLISCSQKQVLIVAAWLDEATGIVVPFSALLDLVPDIASPDWGKMIVDIKTARNGNPAHWTRVIDDSGYDVQGAIYFDLYRAARPEEDRTDFVHVIIENTFPFHVVSPPPALSSEFLEWGRAKYKAALRAYCECLKTGVWPSYPTVGIRFGKTQIIGPESCWNYRNCTGMAELKLPEEKPANDGRVDFNN
jgi:hypothetical protein